MPEKALNLLDPLNSLKGIGPSRNDTLIQAGISTIQDLINYYPRKYLDRTNIIPIGSVKNNSQVNIVGKIEAAGLVKGRKRQFFKAILSDKSGMITLTWFNGARYINKLIKIGDRLAVSGKVEFYNKLQIVHPQYDKLNTKEDPLNSGIIMSLYPISGILRKNRIDSLFFRKIIRKIYGELREIPDFFKEDFRKKYNIISLDKALREIHFPHSNTSLDKAIKRLKFNEHFFFQLQMLSRRKLAKNLPTVPLKKLVYRQK